MSTDTTNEPSSFSSESEMSFHEKVCRSILEVAPDLEPDELEASTDLVQDLGLDSIDLVNIAGAIAERTGVEIPDVDFARLHRIGSLVEFVRMHSHDHPGRNPSATSGSTQR